ncbi:MAG TPA: hypothetical protein VHA30_04130, partial [Patescibacteria group bacterium]|nr:hypothetical protein [Patescibacteria group bacterium]
AEAPPSGMHAIPLATVTPESLQPPEISNDLLFNTRLEDLQEYLSAVDQAAASSTRAEFMANRREKLKAYLTDMHSPFLSEADTIAEQPHWKLILAISFAESTLGKRCYMYNCSGIGGSNIKTYDSLQSWIEDFNDLLERRYKDKTLEQMCGVYVQPCNPNWLLATKQVLTDLKERGIE